MRSDQLSKETDTVDQSQSQVVDNDVNHVNDILQFSSESTPPPKTENAAELNGSGKQTRKNKRAQWFTVRM